MKTPHTQGDVRSPSYPPSEDKPALGSTPGNALRRRSFLKGLGVAGAALLPGATLLTTQSTARAGGFGRGLTQGDVDVLRFAAAAEILETDLWVQYQELADHNAAYAAALANLDADMVQYVDDNTDDEETRKNRRQ
jgi:hypothetical protein